MNWGAIGQVILVVCAVTGSGAALLVFRSMRNTGKAILDAIHDVPLIVPLHEAAMEAIDNVEIKMKDGFNQLGDETRGVHLRLDVLEKQVAHGMANTMDRFDEQDRRTAVVRVDLVQDAATVKQDLAAHNEKE